MNAQFDPIAESWRSFKAVSGICRIADESDYDRAIALIDHLVEAGALEEGSPLVDLYQLIADLVQRYEDKVYPLPPISGSEMLRFLMEQHQLRQSDLVEELGSQSVVSEVLSGRRELNKNHISALAKRFSVSPAVFFE